MGIVLVTIGNIGSGKSTYLKALLQKQPSFRVISLDAIRYMIGGGKYLFDRSLEPIVFRTAMVMYREFLKQGENIILDEKNISVKTRKAKIAIAKEFCYAVYALEFPRLTKEEAVTRRMNNPHDCPDRDMWESVWEQKNKRYQSPSSEEGFDSVVTISREEVGLS